MPPRIRPFCPACPRVVGVLSVPESSSSTISAAFHPFIVQSPLPLLCSSSAPSASRAFSTTLPLGRISTQRKDLYLWLQRHGRRFVGEAQTQEPDNYLGPLPAQPFPMNPLFRSQAVLSEAMREQIWEQVVVRNESLKAVSAVFHVDVRRVAAVVRMKQVEKQWQAQVGSFLFLCSHVF